MTLRQTDDHQMQVRLCGIDALELANQAKNRLRSLLDSLKLKVHHPLRDTVHAPKKCNFMQIEQVEKEITTIRLSQEEVVIINNALNEVCNGLDMNEFSTRIGASRANVEELLFQIGKIIDAMK
ncbi:hypothetical protein [Nostoc sp.]|uniref:hypothetical protein n=1 Tax=Nostoc sp. TaxID=1180 RepID=UPI002FFC9FFD